MVRHGFSGILWLKITVPFMGQAGGAPTGHEAPHFQKMAGQPFSGKNGRPRQRAHILP